MPNLPFEYHPDAILEAHEAIRWYAERSSQAADRFWDELIRARKLVTERPQGWTPYFHETRVFQFRHYPYGLVYIERPDKIVGLTESARSQFDGTGAEWRELAHKTAECRGGQQC